LADTDADVIVDVTGGTVLAVCTSSDTSGAVAPPALAFTKYVPVAAGAE
jgi:hypothetical protein